MFAFPLSFVEVEESYKKALEQEEERITYQRKMLLLSVKKIRERENEMLIQGRNSLLRQRVEANESELESMLRSLEKQVGRCSLSRAYETLNLELFTKLKSFYFRSGVERKSTCRWLRRICGSKK